MCGQICAAELSKKTLISGADPRRRSRAERIGITEIKIEKGAILLQNSDVLIVGISFMRVGHTIETSIYEMSSEEQFPIEFEVKYIQ
jgi:hypothetical protein